MTTTEAIKQLQTEHDLIATEHDLNGSQFAPALLEALAMAIEVLKCSEIPNCSEPKCADGCIYGWGSSECGHCDYRSEEPKIGDCISRQVAIDTEGLDAQIRCEMCRNPMNTDRGCDGNCKYDEKLYERIMQILDERIRPLPSAQQELKSPLYYGDGYSEGKMVYDSAECPNCGYIYDEGDHVWGEPYCPHCGQALDWYMRGEQDE